MPKKMTFFIPFITKGKGGTENVGQMMANAMACRGHLVDIITFDEDERPPTYEMQPSIRLHYLPEPGSAAFRARAVLLLAQLNPDVVVGLHMNRTLLEYVTCCLRVNKPCVLSEHIDPKYPRRIGNFTAEERLMAFSGATKIHLLTDSFRNDLPAFLRAKAEVIPNTTRLPQRAADPIGTSRTKSVVTVARLVPRKNMKRLLQAFAKASHGLTDWKLSIVGDGGQMPELKARSQQLGLTKRVEFIGHTNSPEEHLQRAQIFCLASLFEGFPMSSLEAMAHGLPIVGYAICNGLNLQVEHGVNGLLSSGGVTMGSLADDLRCLMQDGARRSEMGNASKDRFVRLFSNETIEKDWEDLFLQAAEVGAVFKPPSDEELANCLLYRHAFASS